MNKELLERLKGLQTISAEEYTHLANVSKELETAITNLNSVSKILTGNYELINSMAELQKTKVEMDDILAKFSVDPNKVK